jgi:glycogen debranching enzyme
VRNERIPPQEAIRIEERWYVLATASRDGDAARVLKHGESFALFDRFGDMPRAGTGEHGFYHQGTRFLSLLELRIDERRPMLLHSSVRRDNSMLAVDVTNPDFEEHGELRLAKGTVHLSRSWILWEGACHERLHLSNYGLEPVVVRLSMEFAADYADIFEVRGFDRERRGRLLEPVVDARSVTLGYEGLDGVMRRTRLEWSAAPRGITAERVDFEVGLEPQASFELHTRVGCESADATHAAVGFADACLGADEERRIARGARATVRTPNEQFNTWIERSAADIAMLTWGNPEGAYPYAGVPWYSVPFGRDGILTALQYLWVDPAMARGVLLFLAATQSGEESASRDAEPGKIVHEMRKGELAALGEIPFGRYYGTVDATPLFVVLAGEYHQRTGDEATLRALWPNIGRALDWIERYGDADGDGFVEYRQRSDTGLRNQGWKDSDDSIFHDDGRLADAPVALSEVQGYVYLAKCHAARLARTVGEEARAGELEAQARALQERFERHFWCEELGTYAIALDGDKRPCRVRSSNAGHVLWSGIASEEHGRRAGDMLMAAESFSGWGVRTIAQGEARYNPMSYHNGSIWPHDNALAAMGLARYGMKDHTARLATSLYEASLFMDLHRLPELFCGFERRHQGEGPTLYPVACSPQAWASATAFYLIKACLGLSFRLQEPRIRFLHPVLPRFLDRLRLVDLRVGEAVVDVQFERHGAELGVQVTRQQGEVDVSVVL